MSMSSGSRVRREGTIAMSSKPYARRPFLPRPISTSMEAHPTFDGGRNGDDSSALRPHDRAETALFAGNLSGVDRGLRERFHRHLGHQPIHLRRVDHTGAHVADRLRPAGHGEAQALVGAPPAVARRHVAGEERVARADRGHRVDHVRVDRRPVQLPVRLLADQPEAARLERHDRLASAHLGDLADRRRTVLLVRELVPHELLGLGLVRGDHGGLRARGHAERLALRVEHGGGAQLLHLLHETRVEVVGHPARQAAREHHHARALGEVQQLVDEQLELGLAHRRPALVDLGLLAGGGIDHRGRGARLLPDAHEVVEDRLLGELLDYPRAGAPSRHARRDDRLAERLQHASHVHALAARHGGLLHRAVAPPEPEVRDRQGAVDGGIESDGDDHLCLSLPSPAARTVLARSAPTQTAARARKASAAKGAPSVAMTLRGRLAAGTSDAVTSGTVRTTLPRYTSAMEPTRLPFGIGPSTFEGALTRVETCSPRRTVRVAVRGTVSVTRSLPRYLIFGRATTAPRVTGRTRSYCARPYLRRASVSASRADSLGSWSTTLTT